MLSEGLDDAQPAFVGNKNGDAKAAIAGAAKKIEAVYNYPYQNHATMEPMNATALYTRGQMRGLVRHAERRSGASPRCSKPPACRPPNATSTSRFSAAASAGAAQTDYVRQAVAIAKQMPGTPVKLLWSREEDMQHGMLPPDHAVQADRRVRCRQQPDRAAHAAVGPVDPVRAAPAALVNGMDPAAFQGLNADGRGGDRLHGAEPAGRPCDAQSARAAGLLARRQRQPERDLSRMLHRRACACGRPGSARVPAQADGQASQASGGAQRGGRARSAGTSRRRRACIAASPSTWATAATSLAPPRSRSPTAARSRCIASSPPPIPATPSIRRRSSGRSRARSSTACPALFYGGCTVKDGRIEQANFDTYKSMRIAEMPKVESIVMPTGGFWGGVGEPTICVAAPAVLNAYLRRDRQTHPLRAAAGSEHHLRLISCRGGRAAAAASLIISGSQSWTRGTEATRRTVVRGIAATARVAGVPAPRARDGHGTIVVIGGGFAGASLRANAEAIRPEARRDAGRGQPDLHRLPVQQQGDRRPAGDRRAAIRLRQDRPPMASPWRLQAATRIDPQRAARHARQWRHARATTAW